MHFKIYYIYSILLNDTQLYSTLLNSTRHYSTLLDTTQLYSTLLNTTQHYSTLLDTTQLYSRYSTLLNTTRHYSTLLDTTQLYSRYSTLLNTTRRNRHTYILRGIMRHCHIFQCYTDLESYIMYFYRQYIISPNNGLVYLSVFNFTAYCHAFVHIIKPDIEY